MCFPADLIGTCFEVFSGGIQLFSGVWRRLYAYLFPPKTTAVGKQLIHSEKSVGFLSGEFKGYYISLLV